MINTIQQDIRVIDPTTHVVIATIPAARPEHRARVEANRTPGGPVPDTLEGIRIRTHQGWLALTSCPLSDSSPLLVSALVAQAMRDQGLIHLAGVYTCEELVFAGEGSDRRPLGTPGLVYHPDLSGSEGGEAIDARNVARAERDALRRELEEALAERDQE